MNGSRKPLHEALAAAKLVEGSGGGGGTSDYTQLTNKPSINGTILVGNKTLADLGIEWVWRGTRAQYEAAAATIPPNTFVDITDEPDMDNVPTQGSTLPVQSGGVYDALAEKQSTIDSSHKLSADLVDDTSTTNKFVSAAEKTSIGTSATKLTGVNESAANYIELVNGKRLYLSDTEPTGTIPEGAFWIGGTVST